MMGKGGCITKDWSLLQAETLSRTKHSVEKEVVTYRHCTVEEKNGSFHKDVGPRNQMERHASQEGDNPTDRNFVSLPFVLLERLIKCLENCNVVEAGCALQLTVENLRTLVKPDVCIASAYEIQTLNRGREISIDCVKTPFELNGIMLLNRPNLESHFYANLANVTGALALKCYKFDIAIEAFLLSVGMHEKSVHADDRDSLFGLGVAQNNIGCVHFIKGELQKAQEAIEVGLNYFNRANRKEISEGDNIMDSEEEIKVTQNNLSLVFQAQRKYQTALQIRSRLLFSKDEKLKLSSRTIVAVMYNQACLSTELCNLGKAVRELEEVKSFCETELDEDDDLLNFLSLKIALIYLMMGRPHCAAASIDVEALMLPDVKEVLGRRRKCSVNFSAATLEVLLDIFVQQGKLDAASSFLADFEPACKETFGADHPRVASIQFRLGSVLFLMGQSIPSKKWLIESLEIFTESFGVNHPDVLKCNVALARVASLAGSQEEILLHSQRVVESVEEIYQESYQVLKKELAGVLLQKGTCLPQVGNEEKIKRESLIADYSVELVSVLYREGPNDLHDSRDTPDGIQDCRYPTKKMSEDICGKLSHDFLKAGLWFFRVGMAVQSNTFLLSACLYCEAFHGSSDHSDVVLLRAILAVCEVRSKCQNILAKKRLLRKEFDSVRRYIEYRTRIGRDPESKMCLFFDEQVNLKTSLALFLPSLVEMEMFNAISVAQELFSRLPYGSNRKNVQITLGEELRCFFAKTPIDCLGRPAIHEFVVSTLVGIDNWTHGLESKTSKQDAMCKTLALPGRRKENDIQPQRFLVTCSTSTQVDIKVLKEINRNSVRSIQANLPSLSLWNENQIAPTQYFIQLKPIVSKETDVSLIRTELDLLLLCLSRSNKQPQSAEESQLVDFVSAEHTCEAALSFTFRKIVASQVLFRKFIVLVLQDQRNLGEVEVLTLHEDFVALNVLSPRKARITLACNGTCINVNSQFVSTRPGPKLCINGLLTCSCTTVETFFREEMEKCTELYGVRYEVLTEKARCISFPPPCTALPVDLAMTKGQRCSLISGLNDHCLVDFEQQEQQTVKSIWLSDVPCQVPSKEVQAAESANQNTCHSNQDDLKRESPRNFVEESVALTACWSSEGFVSHKQPWALRSDPQNSSFIDDVPLLTETFTQTDSLSIPLENEKPNTVESGTQTRVIDSAGFLDNEVDDCTKERRQSNPYSEEFAETRQANIRLGEACSSSQLPGSESVATVPSFPLPMSQRFLWDEELLESEQSTGGDNYSEEEKQELGRLLFEQEKQSRNLRRSCFFLELGQTRHPRITKAESNACSSGGAPAIKDVLVHSGGNHHKEEHDLEDASTQQLRNEMQHELHIIGNPLFCRSQEIDLGGRLDEAVDPFVVTDPNNGEDDVGEQQTKERKCDKPSTDGDGLSMVFCATTTSETSCESNSSFSIQGNAGNDVTDGFVGTETMSSTNWAPQIIADSWREEASVFYPHQTDSNSTSAVEGNLEISVGKELIKGRKIMIREDRIKEEQKRDNGECDGDGIEKAQEQIISGATSGKREGGRERNINRPTKNAISASPFHGGDVETDSSPGCPSRAVHQRFVAGNADDSAGKICSQLEGSILDSPFIESAEETASGLNRNETDAEKLARLVQTSDPDYNDVIETESDHLEVDTSLESEQLNTSYNNWYQQGARPKMLRNPSVDTSNNTLGSTNPDNLSKTPRDSLRFGLNPHFLARHTEDNGMSTGMPPESDAWDEDLQEEEPGDIILEPQTGSQPSPDWRGHYPSLPPSPSLFIKDSNGLWGTREFAMSGSLEQQHINQEQMPSVPAVIPMGTFNRSEGFEQLNNNQGWMPSAPVSAVPPMYPVNPFIPGEHQLTRRYFEDIPRYTPGMFNPHNEWKRNGQMEPLAAADWILPPPPPPSLPNTAVSSMNLHLMGSVSPNAASQIASRGFADEVNRQILPLEAVNWTLPTPHPPSLHNTSVNPYLTGSECFDSATLSFQPNAASQIASIGNADEVGFPRAQPLVPEDDRMMSRLPASNVHENQCGTGWRWSTNVNDSNSRDKTASDKACNTDNSNYEPSTQQSDNSTTSVEDRASSLAILGESRPQSIATCTDSHDSDESLAALERRVAEACALVERVLREKEEKDQLRRERERREREERETREREERERRDRERREREERETREREERERREREASERVQRNEHELGGPIQETPRWLCEHYQRRCRVKFPCCERFYPCHRCHNNSEACQKDDSKAKQATHIECTVCKHQQEINEDSQSCTSCGTLMSAYFCSICRHFTGVDKNPYHCKKCGICRIHQDRSFHCEVCNVCLDKRLQGKHKCRPDSGHDECCICLEDAFSGCQILPCSHKVHKDCAILMIQNGVRTCPICRHPLYNPDRSNRP